MTLMKAPQADASPEDGSIQKPAVPRLALLNGLKSTADGKEENSFQRRVTRPPKIELYYN
jgi:hypothetical protein